MLFVKDQTLHMCVLRKDNMTLSEHVVKSHQFPSNSAKP